MAEPLVLGTLVVVLTKFILLLRETTPTLNVGTLARGRSVGPSYLQQLSDATLVSSVDAFASSQSTTLRFLINGSPVDVSFPTTPFSSATAIATFLEDALQTEFGSLTVTANSGKLTINAVSASPAIEFGFAPNANLHILSLLGFRPPPATVTTLVATHATALRIFDFTTIYKLQMGDTISIVVPTLLTLTMVTTGAFEVLADTKRLFTPHQVQFLSLRLKAFTTQTLTIKLGGRNIESSTGYYLAERYQYSSSTTFTKPSNTVSIYAEVVGCGGSSLTSQVYGGAGACVAGYLSTMPSTLTLTVGTQSGDFSRITGTNIDIIAGGGGMGGTLSSVKRPATGGSSGHHGSNGFPIFVEDTRLGTYSSVLNTGGRGGTNTAGGLSGLGTNVHGSSLQGAEPASFAAGGSGHFGGGAGGRRVIQGQDFSGGGGAGSSLLRGLAHPIVTRPTNEQKQPKTTKLKFEGTYGNGGTSTVNFGRGNIALIVTRLAGV